MQEFFVFVWRVFTVQIKGPFDFDSKRLTIDFIQIYSALEKSQTIKDVN